MFNLNLQWLSFPVNLQTVEAWIKTNAGTNYVGNSADYDLTLWFSAQPTNDQIATIQAYWSSLNQTSAESTGYQSMEQTRTSVAASKASLLASATQKLSALGLTTAEIAALIS